jgi:hypothetical protein
MVCERKKGILPVSDYLGWANEGEIQRVKEKDNVLATVV